jgi:hypothetical protein
LELGAWTPSWHFAPSAGGIDEDLFLELPSCVVVLIALLLCPFHFFAGAVHGLTQLPLFEARRMVALRFTRAIALLYTVTIAQAANFTIINGQIFTPGLAIVDAPQPNTPLGGGRSPFPSALRISRRPFFGVAHILTVL